MKSAVIPVFAALLAANCFAQTEEKKAPDAPRYYRLDFAVKELDGGKVISVRKYSTGISSKENEGSSIRTGDKVPVPTGTATSYSYMDVGLNIDSRVVRATDTHLVLFVSADNSGFVPASGTGGSAVVPPVMRQNRWSGNVVVPLRKATTIYSADGASEKRQMQIEVTATPIQ